MNYSHTQNTQLYGYLVFAVLPAFLLLLSRMPGTIWPYLLMLCPIVISVLFSSLTTTVTADTFSWHFGPGFWCKSLARSEIASVEPTRLKWWYGWGIRYTPRGWLYNIYGLDGVAVTTRAGKTILIGTDEPDALVTALRYSS